MSFAYLLSYPRSGNTWLRMLISAVVHPEELPTYELTNKTIFDFHQRPEEESDKCPIVKSHHRWMPRYEGKRIVYILRDGRDVALSYYRFGLAENHFEYMPFRDFFLNFFIRGKVLFGSWVTHLSFWVHPKDSNVLVISYDDLKNDTVSALGNVCDFLWIDYNEEIINNAVLSTEFSEVKKRELARYPELNDGKVGVSGTSGNWKEFFDEEMLFEYSAWAGELHAYLREKRMLI